MLKKIAIGWFAFVGVFILAIALVVVIIAGPFTGTKSGGGAGSGRLTNTDGIPREYIPLIITAAADAGCPEVTPAILAAQLHQESGFNAGARSPVGALGIAQFLPATWQSYGQGGDIFDPVDAIPAAARYDCSVAAAVAGVPGDAVANMLAGYNAGPGAVLAYAGVPPYIETQNYVRVIQAQAAAYGDGLANGVEIAPAQIQPVLAFVRAQLGKPYVWGSTGPDSWDCSSLVQAAYRTVGVELPRVTFDQVKAAPRVSGVDPQPGDLLFSAGSDGTPDNPGHVAMYVGNGRMIDAKGVRWGVVESALTDAAMSRVIAVVRPLAAT